jgi:exodeoxyribonuclease-3
MSLSVATWNINSVRLRINNVKRYLRLRKPDVLCLQETKCPDEFFPHKAFEGLGYTHRLVQGMKSYNGVAILSKVPFTANNIHHRCGKEDCRHIEVALDTGGDPILLDNLYIPAGGDIPDPALNDKFAHKLDFYREMAQWFADRKPPATARKGLRRIAVGDLNVAPLEHDVWSHKQLLKIVSHTPVSTGSTCRAASCPTTRSSIRGGATATTTGAPPTAAGGSTISWPRRPCPAPSGVIASTSARATGSRRPTTCR